MKRWIVITITLICWIMASLSSNWAEAGQSTPTWFWLVLITLAVVDAIIILDSEEL